MYIINTTFCCDPQITLELSQWCISNYIPAAEAFGFSGLQLCRIMATDNETDSVSYALQMQCADIRLFDQWLDSRGGDLLKQCMGKWPNRLMPFTTYMQKIY